MKEKKKIKHKLIVRPDDDVVKLLLQRKTYILCFIEMTISRSRQLIIGYNNNNWRFLRPE